jgi:hypothetical protein
MSKQKLDQVNELVRMLLLIKQDCLNSSASVTDQAIAQLAAYNALLAKLTEVE